MAGFLVLGAEADDARLRANRLLEFLLSVDDLNAARLRVFQKRAQREETSRPARQGPARDPVDDVVTRLAVMPDIESHAIDWFAEFESKRIYHRATS